MDVPVLLGRRLVQGGSPTLMNYVCASEYNGRVFHTILHRTYIGDMSLHCCNAMNYL